MLGQQQTVSCALDGTFPGNTAASNTATAVRQVQTASFAGTVFQDRDRSGANGGLPQASAVEPRIAAVRITLTCTDAFGNAISRAADTDGSGNYSFTNLQPAGAGGYTLTETQPAGFDNSPASPPTSGAAAPSGGGTYARGGTAGDSVCGIAPPHCASTPAGSARSKRPPVPRSSWCTPATRSTSNSGATPSPACR